ncbi:MAG: hypothetical protein AAB778_03435 [Patescibacteria group bacterium]
MKTKILSPFLRYFFVIVLVLSTYHFVRDILQTFGIHNAFTNILHRSHTEWCRSYCNFVTYPLYLLGMIGSYIVLNRNKLGTVGVVLLISLLFWLLALLP